MKCGIRSAAVVVMAALLGGAVGPRAAGPDWLLDGATYKATVGTDQATGDVVLDNGLVRRVIRTREGCATIALNNLMTGQQMVRSVRPEAEVELDGVKYAVGGLEGQPVQNYLDAAWLAKMKAQTGAFEFTGLETGKTVERFPWKKRLEWMPQDMPWPAPGVSLTLHFRAPASLSADERPRKVLVADDFAKLDSAWRVFLSTKHSRTSFVNEGKVGEIMALSETHAYVERPLPAGARVVQCKLDAGTDKGASSGPGMVLVFEDGQTVKFNLRPGDGHKCFGINELDVGKLKDGATYTLRMRLVPGKVVCEASTDDKTWEKVYTVDTKGEAVAVRLGKTGRVTNDATDYAESKGEPERCHILGFTVLGEVENLTQPATTGGVTVDVHYELYDGLPLLSKWITVKNGRKTPVRLNKFVCEILAAVEAESVVDPTSAWRLPNIFVDTDYTFGGMSATNHGAGFRWVPDPQYGTQVNYAHKTPCLLECAPAIGPDQFIAPGGTFASIRAFELVQDSTDRERQTLGVRRMYRAMAPWVTENPILMHVSGSDEKSVKRAVDQCADVGFQMVIMTFGSGFNFESRDEKYQERYKELADYARAKHVALGGYSLLASRGAATGADNTQGEPARFGVMPCLGSAWGMAYLRQIEDMCKNAGLEVFENDGSYPGDLCAATTHPGHHGLEDSQWVQWKGITGLYEWCAGNGVYLNIPDWYFMNGGTKTGMGYRETNWSLPREYQEIIERQNIFDGTWEKTPSMGWMFVPLTQYHGGGAAATIEPLKEHLPHYGQRLANLFGAGVQACYRGPRLFDAPETHDLVKKWVDFYKKHRGILDSDIIHLRRADGSDLDYILHVNAALQEKGLLMVYNPLDKAVQKTLTIPLYYTGLTEKAAVREQDGAAVPYVLDREFKIELPVNVAAHGTTWFVIAGG